MKVILYAGISGLCTALAIHGYQIVSDINKYTVIGEKLQLSDVVKESNIIKFKCPDWMFFKFYFELHDNATEEIEGTLYISDISSKLLYEEKFLFLRKDADYFNLIKMKTCFASNAIKRSFNFDSPFFVILKERQIYNVKIEFKKNISQLKSIGIIGGRYK